MVTDTNMSPLPCKSGEGADYSFDISGDLETDEAEPRAIEKDAFDWPGATGLYMGLFERRDHLKWKMQSGLWDRDGMSQNWPEIPNLRQTSTPAINATQTREAEFIRTVKDDLRGPDGEEYTDSGMEYAFFRWPVVERAIRAALNALGGA